MALNGIPDSYMNMEEDIILSNFLFYNLIIFCYFIDKVIFYYEI